MFRILLVIAALILAVAGYALYLAVDYRLDRTATVLPIIYIAAAILAVALVLVARARRRNRR